MIGCTYSFLTYCDCVIVCIHLIKIALYVCVCVLTFDVPSWGFGTGEVMRHLLTMKRAWKTECSLWLRDGCRLHPKDLAACGLYVPPPYLLGEPIPRVSLQSMSFQFSGDHRYSEGVFAWVWMVYLSGNKACRNFLCNLCCSRTGYGIVAAYKNSCAHGAVPINCTLRSQVWLPCLWKYQKILSTQIEINRPYLLHTYIYIYTITYVYIYICIMN